jgi:hypothetical protein
MLMRFACLLVIITIALFSCSKLSDTIISDAKLTGTSATNIQLSSSINAVDSFTVDITGRWTIKTPSTATWFKLSATTGVNAKKIYVTSTAENTSSEARSVNIEVKAINPISTATTITIIQKARQWIVHKLVGGANWDVFGDVLPTSDGGFIAVGSTWSSDGDILSNNGTADAWAVRFRADGTIMWSKTYGDVRWNAAGKILKVTGGYAVLASTVLEENQEGNVGSPLLMKIDENGDQLWSKTFDLGTEQGLTGFSATASGDIICSGTGNDQAVLMLLNESGEEIWRKSYGAENADFANDVIQSSDGGFIATGRKALPRIGTQADWDAQDAWIFKVDADGNELWSKLYGGLLNESAFYVAAANDGGAVVAATTESIDIEGYKGQQDLLLLKVDADGNLQSQKPLGSAGREQPNSIKVLDDGNILLCSYIEQANGDVAEVFGSGDVWLLEMNTSGDILWQKTLGGPDLETITGMSVYNNKIFLAGSAFGTTGDFSTNHGSPDGWVVVLNQP